MANKSPNPAYQTAFGEAVTRLNNYGKKLASEVVEELTTEEIEPAEGVSEARMLVRMALLDDARDQVKEVYDREYTYKEFLRQIGDEKSDDRKDGIGSTESNLRKKKTKPEKPATAGNGRVVEARSVVGTAADPENVQRVASSMDYNTSGKVGSTKHNKVSTKGMASGRALWHGDVNFLPEEGSRAADWPYWADRQDPKKLTVRAQTAWLEVISKTPRELTPRRMVPWCQIITGQERMEFRDAQKLIRELNKERIELGGSRYLLAGEGIDTHHLLAVILGEYRFWWKDRKND